MAKRSKLARGSATEQPVWHEAIAFAAWKHRNQVRRDGRTPYVSHVMRVCMTVTQIFGCADPVAVCAALLHDTIEDTTTDFDDIADLFGRDVAECVAALTKNMALPDKDREREYDQRLAKADWRARLVKLADAYDNLCDLPTKAEFRKPDDKRKALERCRRAVMLAQADSHIPVMSRAARVVEKLVKEKTGQGRKRR
ncbi:MAG: bifunctional (p)ppGpp synthetase/guanosine-3',5'-bis(diphosphate) 3'-pyrophosphohydrolase [Planctomycetes bacterium]|nr:bifunctional (p)ppGpp synthetase/guanosine-3',5'-bis(diphosphate) 3'-pyrophosphohydrolase [Planctomycetota bacterium]